MTKWTTCQECSEVLYADANGEFFCARCDGIESDGEFDCWLDDQESSFMSWVDADLVRN